MLVRHQRKDGGWDALQAEKNEAGEVYTAATGALILELCCGSRPAYMRGGTVQPSAPRQVVNDISVAIVRPAVDSRVENAVPIEAKPTVPEGVFVESLTAFLDGRGLGTLTAPPWIWNADAGFGFRQHIIRVVARNELGKEAEAAIATKKPDAWVKVHIVDPRDRPALGRHRVLVETQVGPDAPLQSVELKIDGVTVWYGSEPCVELDHDFGGLGAAEILAVAKDQLGNQATDRVLLPEAPPIEVDLTATVSDATGRSVLDLEKSDFTVAEDGMPQQILRFSRQQTAISLALVLDASGSMKPRVKQAQAAAIRFVRQIQPGDQFMVLQFSDAVQLTQGFTGDAENLVAAVRHVGAKGGTALYDAVAEGCQRLQAAPGRRAMLLVTDGKDENDAGTAPGSQRSIDESLRMAREGGVTIYAVGLGKAVERGVLERFAQDTGGRAYFPPAVAQMDEIYRLIGQELRSVYTIGYSSSNRRRDGAWRDVQLAVPGRMAQVHCRNGYFAPKAEQ